MAAMQLRHDELAWFIHAVAGIERLLTGTIGALLIFMLAAVGVYLISQLLGVFRRRLAKPDNLHCRSTAAVDTWRESAARLRETDQEP